MSEYIERSLAIGQIYELINARYEWRSDARAEIQGLNAAMCAIEDVPSADVVPVRHGRWTDCAEDMCVCTACGWGFIFPYKTRAVQSKLVHSYSYCPHCGAKMEGDI